MYERIVCLGGLFKPPFGVRQGLKCYFINKKKEVFIWKIKCYNMERYILITKEFLEGEKMRHKRRRLKKILSMILSLILVVGLAGG